MVFLRALMFFELICCSILYFAKRLEWSVINDLAVMDWVFMFSYPMAYFIFIIMLVLVVKDILRFKDTRKNIYLLWGIIDITIPFICFFLFEAYYSLIGHM